MANIIGIERVAITTKKGESLDTMRIFLDGAATAEQKKWLYGKGFSYFKANWNWDEKTHSKVYTSKGYWGIRYDDKLFKSLSKKVAKPAEPKKQTAKQTAKAKATPKKQTAKAEPKKSLDKLTKKELIALLQGAGLA